MDPLPLAPSCALDDSGLRLQYARYRQVGHGASLVSHGARGLVLDLELHVDEALVDELLAVERACCPFFELSWEPARRRLSISVTQGGHEPALDSILFALGLSAQAGPGESGDHPRGTQIARPA